MSAEPAAHLRPAWSRACAGVVGAVLVAAVAACSPVATEASGAAAATSSPTTAVAGAEPSPTPTPTPSTSPTPTPATAPSNPARPATTAPQAPAGSALAAVAGLAVKGRAPKTGYSRDQFGPAWADVDRNGCDTRNDILNRDLTDVVTKAGTHGCVVLTGTFHDPYSGETIAFERGQATSSAVQIDHVVALSDAWQKGAQQWSAQAREQLANDPLNLLASKGSLNSAKGDGDAATWLPPNKGFRCAYVARQVAVKRSYGLWVTTAERDAMVRVLSTCPGEPLPTGSLVTSPPAAQAAQQAPAPQAPAPQPAASTPVPAAPAPAAPAADPDVYYQNCTAARAAGAAPLHVGDPGYRAGLDRDKDGVACE